MKQSIWFAAILLPLMAQAQDKAASADSAASLPQGEATRGWMDLQISGRAAEPELRPVAGEVAGEVYQRYVNSFKYAIPEAFGRDAFVSGGGSK